MHYLFSVQEFRMVRCDECGLMLLNPQPSDEELARIYSAGYFLLGDAPGGLAHVTELKRATARGYLGQLQRYTGGKTGRLLELGSGQGDLLLEAQALGYDVTGVEGIEAACAIARDKLGGGGRVVCGDIAALAGEAARYDVCVISDVIEHVRDPREFLAGIHRLLKPDGVMLVTTCSLDSWSARFFKTKWMEFKPEHLVYYSSATLQSQLARAGFDRMVTLPGWKSLSAEYIADHFRKYAVPGVTALVGLGVSLLPAGLRRRPMRVVASGLVSLSRARPLRPRPLLSIVVPAYNEAGTIREALDRLLAKTIDGLDIEIVVVESNSTDGTRAIVESFRNHPRVTLVLEDRPRGKGHAVRAGFARLAGDFVLIQDADLEYDLEDYDALLEPLMTGRQAFVLGSRHGGRSWKMRTFSDQPVAAFVMNVGHWVFAGLVDVMFGLTLRDPFTMFKVFRRDCLTGLTFDANRFDFDFELLIKLVRKGYRPVEIPVNYRSRSYTQGKKVSMWRDPWTWIRALVKYRLCRIDPLAEVERRERSSQRPLP
jgi:glycosyltransferase involved in cell wall biosynthesis/ubiquinone/menaquinone biosynthesis C-methylase UbiE